MIIVDHTMRAFDLFENVLVVEEGKAIYFGDSQCLLEERYFLKKHRLIL